MDEAQPGLTRCEEALLGFLRRLSDDRRALKLRERAQRELFERLVTTLDYLSTKGNLVDTDFLDGVRLLVAEAREHLEGTYPPEVCERGYLQPGDRFYDDTLIDSDRPWRVDENTPLLHGGRYDMLVRLVQSREPDGQNIRAIGFHDRVRLATPEDDEEEGTDAGDTATTVA